MFKRGTREDDVEVPNIFWWATGHAAIEQNWETGDFATTVPPRTGEHVQVYGVRFHRVDLNKRIPGLFEALKPIGVTESGERGGRPMSPLWPEWVAELVAVIDEQGIPAGAGSKGTEELIQRVADALAVRELEAPGRSTVQDTVKAVLRRMRSARN